MQPYDQQMLGQVQQQYYNSLGQSAFLNQGYGLGQNQLGLGQYPLPPSPEWSMSNSLYPGCTVYQVTPGTPEQIEDDHRAVAKMAGWRAPEPATPEIDYLAITRDIANSV